MAHQSSGGFGVANVMPYSPESESRESRTQKSEPIDTMPSDYQRPGTDDEKEYQSLEEALLGE